VRRLFSALSAFLRRRSLGFRKRAFFRMSWTIPSFSHFFLKRRIALSIGSPSLTFTRDILASQPFVVDRQTGCRKQTKGRQLRLEGHAQPEVIGKGIMDFRSVKQKGGGADGGPPRPRSAGGAVRDKRLRPDHPRPRPAAHPRTHAQPRAHRPLPPAPAPRVEPSGTNA